LSGAGWHTPQKPGATAYGRVQEILGRDLPYINLWHATNVAVLNQRVRGFVLYPDEDMISLKDVRLAGNGAPGRP